MNSNNSALSALKKSESGKLTGYTIRTSEGEFQVERSNGFVLSGFSWELHKFMSVDLRNTDAEIIGKPEWE